MMQFAKKDLNAKGFSAKILTKNEASLKLFKEKLGFEEYARLEVFDTICLRRACPPVDDNFIIKYI